MCEHGIDVPAWLNVLTALVVVRGSRREEWVGSCRGRQGNTCHCHPHAAHNIQLRITESQGAASIVLHCPIWKTGCLAFCSLVWFLPMDPWLPSWFRSGQMFLFYFPTFHNLCHQGSIQPGRANVLFKITKNYFIHNWIIILQEGKTRHGRVDLRDNCNHLYHQLKTHTGGTNMSNPGQSLASLEFDLDNEERDI